MKFYNKEFNQLISESVENGQYIGLGNPNSNILFVGKEAGISEKQEEHETNHLVNAYKWKNGEHQYSKSYVPDDSKHRNYNHTWQKYQKVYSLAKGKAMPKEKYEITFLKEVFTTEISQGHARTSKEAKEKEQFKSELTYRKKHFWKSSFVKQFPIVIIAAMDTRYIQNHLEGQQEINDIFGVTYNKCLELNPREKCWLHYGTDKNFPKLVLHTRQFTNGCSDELIQLVANEMRAFMKEHKISWVKGVSEGAN